MDKHSFLTDFAEQFFLRTQNRELHKKPVSNGVPIWVRQLLRTIGVFLIAPILTMLVLLALEMAFIKNTQQSAVEYALQQVLIRSDIIFLVFSLSLTAILEWTISSNSKDAPAFFVVLEGILGFISLIIYVIEEVLKTISEQTTYDAYSNILMTNRVSIHFILLLSVILVSVVGYYRRIMHANKSESAQVK